MKHESVQFVILRCWKRCWCCCVTEKDRQCKFPLVCILRQSWQAEVITERLTHQHGENLTPPGREIAKSQFTHIQLPVRAWSYWCDATRRHPDAADIPVHATIHTLSKLRWGAATSHSLHPSFYSACEHMCYHTPRTSPRFLSNTPSPFIKVHRMTTLSRCVWERQRNRENGRNRWHQASV